MVSPRKDPDIAMQSGKKFDLDRAMGSGNVIANGNYEVFGSERARKLAAKGIARAKSQQHEFCLVSRRTRGEDPFPRSSVDIHNTFLQHLCASFAGLFQH